jgi:hypothetical protein
MQIDDYKAARALTKKLSDHLPIKAYAGKRMAKMLQEQGKKVDLKNPYIIESVNYSGDTGGIMCTLEMKPEDGEMYVISITHLKIDPDHPLAPEIKAYQNHRITMLKIQDQKGFAAELLQRRSLNPKSTKPKSTKKGFG